jgi:hypothetical protein
MRVVVHGTILGVERGRACSLRVQVVGTRRVLMADAAELQLYMLDAGLTSVTPEAVVQFLKAMSKDVVQKYVAGGKKIRVCTLGPGEGLLLPFNWAWIEETLNADILGWCVRFYMKADHDAMDSVNKWLVGTKKPNNILSNACDVIAALDG